MAGFNTQVIEAVAGVFGLVILDWILGPIVAVKQGGLKAWSWAKLPNQLDDIFKKVGGTFLVAILQTAAAAQSGPVSTGVTAGFVLTAAAVSFATLKADIWSKLTALFGSAPAVAPPATT